MFAILGIGYLLAKTVNGLLYGDFLLDVPRFGPKVPVRRSFLVECVSVRSHESVELVQVGRRNCVLHDNNTILVKSFDGTLKIMRIDLPAAYFRVSEVNAGNLFQVMRQWYG
jgi:hypothetical protein